VAAVSIRDLFDQCPETSPLGATRAHHQKRGISREDFRSVQDRPNAPGIGRWWRRLSVTCSATLGSIWNISTMLVLCAPAALGQDFRLLAIDGHRMKWGAPELGTGADVTYGFATRDQSFPGAVNCGEIAPMHLLSAAWRDDPRRLDIVAAEAFAMWSDAADIRFRPAAADDVPDILIGVQAIPRRIAFANVWFDTDAAENGVSPLTRATICFNPALGWGLGDEAPDRATYDFGKVLAHEIGHAIGLDHPGPTGSLMGYRGDIDALMPGDIAGVTALYGASIR
jgi:hypothetical protein